MEANLCMYDMTMGAGDDVEEELDITVRDINMYVSTPAFDLPYWPTGSDSCLITMSHILCIHVYFVLQQINLAPFKCKMMLSIFSVHLVSKTL